MERYYMVFCVQDYTTSDEQEWVEFKTESENAEEEIREQFEEVFEIVEVSELLMTDFLQAMYDAKNFRKFLTNVRNVSETLQEYIYNAED